MDQFSPGGFQNDYPPQQNQQPTNGLYQPPAPSYPPEDNFYNPPSPAPYDPFSGDVSYPPAPKKSKKGLIIGLSAGGGALLLLIVGLIIFLTVALPNIRYNSAVNLFEHKKYSQARDTFKQLGNFKDSPEYLEKCDYEIALKDAEDDFNSGDYLNAAKKYQDIVGLSDADARIEQCADALLAEGSYADAKECYDMVGIGFTDNRVLQCNQMILVNYVRENGEYDDGTYTYAKNYYDDDVKYELSINANEDDNLLYVQYFYLYDNDDTAAGTSLTLYLDPDEVDSEILIRGILLIQIGDGNLKDEGLGLLDIDTCTASTTLTITKFERTGKSAGGKDLASTSLDDSDSVLGAMQKGYTRMMAEIHDLFSATGITPAEIGFRRL